MIVVSEETGRVSYAQGGEIRTIEDMAQLRGLLGKAMEEAE